MWIEITASDVLTRLAGPELTAYQTAALAAGQADPLPEIIKGVIREVRARVAACESNTLGAGQTIPDELLHTALALIRYRLISRLPLAIREERRTEYQDALALLRDVAACDFTIEDPTTPSTEVTASPAPSITARTGQLGRDNEDGI